MMVVVVVVADAGAAIEGWRCGSAAERHGRQATVIGRLLGMITGL